jgi:uncharacterized protein
LVTTRNHSKIIGHPQRGAPAIVFFLLFSFYLSIAFALEIPKRPEGYVSDYAGMISQAVRQRLEERLRQFEEETTNPVVVVTFPSLEGESLEDFSIRLAEAWKIGQKGKDNGVILLIFKNDRQVRIEVGYGFEGALTDATSKLIIENEIVPRFREGRFDEGVENAIQAILSATKGEYHPEANRLSETLAFLGPTFLLGIILGAILPLLLLAILFALGILISSWALVSGAWAIFSYALFLGVVPFLLYFLFGRSSRGHAILSRGGITRPDSDSSGWSRGSRSSSGGDFGGGFGGGGGSFGGGGASGSW